MPGPLVDRTGEVHNSWTVLYQSVPYQRHGTGYWVCRCTCGVTADVPIKNVVSGVSKQCATCSRRVRKNTVTIRWGTHTMNRSDWARSLGIPNQTLAWRIAAGWSLREVMTEGVDPVILDLLVPGQETDPVYAIKDAESGRNQ